MAFLKTFSHADAERTALIAPAEDRALTYGELDALIDAAVEPMLARRNLVFIETRNTIPSIVNYCAALRAGAVVHLMETFSTARAEALIEIYQPNILIGDASFEERHDRTLDLHPDLAILLSTSGSTGTPKFVKLSGRNIEANTRSIIAYLALTPEDRALNNLKPHYSYGLSIINSHLAAGASLILTDHSWMDTAFWDMLNTHGATSISGVPYSYEMLRRLEIDPADFPSLRYATQAGGKLQAPLVRHFAEHFSNAGKQFFVMYGQTEAAPRMSYLPPDLAAKYPHSIGHAVPGGTLMVLDGNGTPIETPGEEGILAYEGANVMMGYATGLDELGSDETPGRLVTGDLARQIAPGLFEIVGRLSRFVKPFGLRIGLDSVEAFAKTMHPETAVTGTDETITIALEAPPSPDLGEDMIEACALRFGLPAGTFETKTFDALPLLANGKVDYAAIRAAHTRPRQTLFGKIKLLVRDALGFSSKRATTVLEAFQIVLQSNEIGPEDSFEKLSGDSLSYVSLTLELEGLMGRHLPRNWPAMPVKTLEALRRDAVIVSAE